MPIRRHEDLRAQLRTAGLHGELALRERDGHLEIISNGVMLMDTRNGESERLLVRDTLAARPGASTILIGGLGVGFSLAEAIGSGVASITVIECERSVIEWNRTHTGPVTGGSVDHPDVDCVHADITTWLPRTDRRFDVICLDIDNGPDWTVSETNAWLYTEDGIAEVQRHLTPGGVLGVWSSERSEDFERRLRETFEEVSITEVEVPRGVPDVIYRGSDAGHLQR